MYPFLDTSDASHNEVTPSKLPISRRVALQIHTLRRELATPICEVPRPSLKRPFGVGAKGVVAESVVFDLKSEEFCKPAKVLCVRKKLGPGLGVRALVCIWLLRV